MRMLIPPVKLRQRIRTLLGDFFCEPEAEHFRAVIGLFCEYYKLKQPTIEWHGRVDNGRSVGRTYEDGVIWFTHPDDWRRNRKYNGEEQWVRGFLHELGHYLFWVDAERKADLFENRMMK